MKNFILYLLLALAVVFTPRSYSQTPVRVYVTYMGTWSSTVSYNQNEIVVLGGTTYISKIPSNLNHTPASNPSDWDTLGSPSSSSGVASLNTLTGPLTLTQGANVTITPSGSSIAISATNSLAGAVLLSPSGAQTITGSITIPTLNVTTGFQVAGSYGSFGQCLISTGSGTSWGSCPTGGGGGNVSTSGTIITGHLAGFLSSTTIGDSGVSYSIGGSSHGLTWALGTPVTSTAGNVAISTDSTNNSMDLSVGGSTPSPICTVANLMCSTASVINTTSLTNTLGGYTYNYYTGTAGSGTIGFTLPAAAPGLQFCVGEASTLYSMTLNTSGTGQYIYLPNTNSTSTSGGGFTAATGSADAACVVGMNTTTWMLYTQSGTWTGH